MPDLFKPVFLAVVLHENSQKTYVKVFQGPNFSQTFKALNFYFHIQGLLIKTFANPVNWSRLYKSI